MSVIYEAIGRMVVTLIRVRFRRQLRVVAVLGIGAAVAVGYLLATRDVEEG